MISYQRNPRSIISNENNTFDRIRFIILFDYYYTWI